MSRTRLIRFERIDKEDGPMGFYLGVHDCSSLTPEEDKEFEQLLGSLYGPRLPLHGVFNFYFTRRGLRRWKRLCHYLIRTTNPKYFDGILVTRKWLERCFVVYNDGEQVAIRVRQKPNRRERMARRAEKL
jgi:hypothetical protein